MRRFLSNYFDLLLFFRTLSEKTAKGGMRQLLEILNQTCPEGMLTTFTSSLAKLNPAVLRNAMSF